MVRVGDTLLLEGAIEDIQRLAADMDLVDVSRGTTDLSPKVAEELSAIRKPVHIQVFGTPT